MTDDLTGDFLAREHAVGIHDHPFVVNLVDKYGEDHPLVELARNYRPWEEKKEEPPPVTAPPLEEKDEISQQGIVSRSLAPYARIAGLSAGALNRAMASFSDSLDVGAEAIANMTGLPKGGLFEGARAQYLKNAEYWEGKFGETGLTEEIMAEFFGGAIPGIADFILGVPWAATKGFSRDYSETGSVWAGMRGATREAIHRHIMGKILHAANRLKLFWRSLALGGTAGGEAMVVTGEPREAARAAGTMVMLGATAGPGYEGPRFPMRRSASSAEMRRPLKEASTTEAPGTQAPSRQTSPTMPTPAMSETRTTIPSSKTKKGLGKNLGETETISDTSMEKISPEDQYVKPGKPLQFTHDIERLLKEAADLEPEVQADLSAAAPGAKIDTRIKERKRLDAKLIRKQSTEPGFSYGHMTDILGTRVIIDDPINKYKAVNNELTAKGYKLLETEDFYENPTPYGYCGIHQLYRAPNGYVFELQFHTPPEVDAINQCHPIYERWQKVEQEHGIIPEGLKEEYKAQLEQSRTIWREAHLKYVGTSAKAVEPIITLAKLKAQSSLADYVWNRKKTHAKEVVNLAESLRKATPKPKVRLAPIEGIAGHETSVRHLEGEDTVEYRLVEADKLQPSHLVEKGFAVNPNYPQNVQPRPYHKDKTLQAQVLTRANPGTFHPPFLITDNPDPINGPPVVTEKGLVMGGNSRTMLIKHVYDNVPESAEAYRTALADRAEAFGLDPAAVAGMKKPTLVRVLKETPADMARTAKNYNEPFTMGQEPGAEAIARARVVSKETMRGLAQGLEDFPTLRAYLGTPRSKQTIKNLVDDGAIEETHLNKYINKQTGLLTEDGKRLVEQTLRGKVIDDYDLMDAAPLSVLQKIDKALPAMTRMQARGEPWDLTGKLKLAIREMIDYRNTDFKRIDEFLAQQEMFTPRPSITDPEVYALFRALDEMKPTEFKDAMNDYARAAEQDVAGQATLGFYKPETPPEAFERLFTPETPATKKFMDLLKSERGAVIFRTPEEVESWLKGPPAGEPVIEITPEIEEKAKQFLEKKVADFEDVPDLEFNWRRIESAQDVTDAIEKVKRLFPEESLKAKGYRGHKEVERLANEMGMSAEQLLKTEGGRALSDVEVQAMRMLHLSSAKRLAELAENAAGLEASELDLFEFRRQLALHNAIQQQVLKFRAESARALGAWRIHARESEAMIREIRDALQAHGGMEQVREMASMLATSLDTPGKLSTAARQMEKATTPDMLLEAWINGLLTNPATHAVNTLSNSLVAAWQVPERMLASQIGRAFGDQEIALAEAKYQAYGAVQGLQDGFRLAWETLKTGEPSDVMSKIEARRYRAITAENLNLSGDLGRAVDLLGEAVRTPGRFLMAEDEFFKSVGYRMELHARAFRQARAEGLEGKQMAERMEEIIRNPQETAPDIHLAAIDAARYQTFTKPLEGISKYVQRAAVEEPVLRVVVPFIRTPVNIMRFGILERTPLAFASKQIREQIRAGGAQRDLALARIALGSSLMAIAGTLAAQGLVTGGGPSDPHTRKIWRDLGYQPYSIRVGNKWLSYNRLEPLGMTLGLGADAAEIIGQISAGEADELAAMVSVAIARNVTSKTYLRGVSDVFNLMSDPDRYGERYVQRLLGSVVPAGVAQLERVIDPTLRQANSVIQTIQSRTPGWSKDLPPRRNLFGEPILLGGGWGPDIISPIYTSKMKDDPVGNEIWKQKAIVAMPAKQIGGIELTPEEYDRYVYLAGQGAKDPATGLNMKQTLADLILDPEYLRQSDGPDGGKTLMIKTHIHAFRELAREQMLEESPELKGLVEGAREEKAAAMQPAF